MADISPGIPAAAAWSAPVLAPWVGVRSPHVGTASIAALPSLLRLTDALNGVGPLNVEKAVTTELAKYRKELTEAGVPETTAEVMMRQQEPLLRSIIRAQQLGYMVAPRQTKDGNVVYYVSDPRSKLPVTTLTAEAPSLPSLASAPALSDVSAAGGQSIFHLGTMLPAWDQGRQGLVDAWARMSLGLGNKDIAAHLGDHDEDAERVSRAVQTGQGVVNTVDQVIGDTLLEPQAVVANLGRTRLNPAVAAARYAERKIAQGSTNAVWRRLATWGQGAKKIREGSRLTRLRSWGKAIRRGNAAFSLGLDASEGIFNPATATAYEEGGVPLAAVQSLGNVAENWQARADAKAREMYNQARNAQAPTALASTLVDLGLLTDPVAAPAATAQYFKDSGSEILAGLSGFAGAGAAALGGHNNPWVAGDEVRRAVTQGYDAAENKWREGFRPGVRPGLGDRFGIAGSAILNPLDVGAEMSKILRERADMRAEVRRNAGLARNTPRLGEEFISTFVPSGSPTYRDRLLASKPKRRGK